MKSSSKALLITSVFMTIGNPILVFWVNFAVVTFIVLPYPRQIGDGIVLFGFLFLILIIIVISIIAGILGLIFWRKPKRASICFITGIFILACNATYFIIFTLAGTPGFALFFFLFSSAIPVYYTIAAYKFKKLSNISESIEQGIE